MPSRPVVALDAPASQRDVDTLLPRLAAAIDGRGPGLLLLPSQPASLRTVLAASARLDEPLERDDVALLVPTSGSTGAPRLAMLPGQAVVASTAATAQRLGGAGGWVLALPAHYVGGLMVLARSALGGRPPVMADSAGGFTPSAFVDAVASLVRRGDELRFTSLVPTQLTRLLDAGGAAQAALLDLDAVLLGGAAASPTLVARAGAAGITVITTYGMTETCGGCVYDGTPLPGVQVEVEADGRIRLAGPTLFAGYRGRAEADAVPAWFRTSDLGRVDAGRLTVLGRADDVVVSGGVKVVPGEVEAALADHPQVAEVVVLGTPSDEWGQEVVVVVAPRGPAPTLEELRAHGRGRLPAAALPRALVVIPSMPRLPSGKPDRVALRTLVAAPPD
jgi:O-succinylbenzoic acid--CoA ligase